MDTVRVTDKLQEVNIDYLFYGKKTITLCNECLNKEQGKPSFLMSIEVTQNTPHFHCNLCGAIDKDMYAKLYS